MRSPDIHANTSGSRIRESRDPGGTRIQSHASQSQSSETRPGHGASHRDAPQPGRSAAPPRAHRDDGAEGEGAAAVRRADHHASPSAASRAARPTASRCTRAGWSCGTSRTATSSASCSTRIAPRFEGRPGGYTRILRIGYRRGDSAEVAQIELVGSEYDPNAETEKAETAAKAKPKGVGGRLRAAAERLRGKKAEAANGRRRVREQRPSRRAG